MYSASGSQIYLFLFYRTTSYDLSRSTRLILQPSKCLRSTYLTSHLKYSEFTIHVLLYIRISSCGPYVEKTRAIFSADIN